MQKYVLVSARSGNEILASEYRDFLMSTGLHYSQLDQVVVFSEDARLPDLSHYSGIFVGGSPFNVTDKVHSPAQRHVQELLLSLVSMPQPKMYVCFGSSLLTYGFDGVVNRRYPEPAGTSVVELTAAGRRDPLLSGLPQRFESLTGHTESVEKLPQCAVLLGSGPTCPYQMFRLNESTWACQFHAEMDPSGMENRMRFYLDYGYFDPAEFDNIVARIHDLDTRHANRVLQNFVRYCASKSPR